MNKQEMVGRPVKKDERDAMIREKQEMVEKRAKNGEIYLTTPIHTWTWIEDDSWLIRD